MNNRSTLPLFALLASTSMACGSVLVEPDPQGGSGGASTTSTSTSTSASGGSTTTSQTTSQGGMGGTSTGCQSSAECPSGNACSIGACDQGVCHMVAAPAGVACPQGVCDGTGQCVECLSALDCSGGAQCVNHACQTDTCANGIQDGDETDIDCGGSCAPCPPPLPCANDLECPTGYCKAGECLPAVLINEVRTTGPMGNFFDDEIVELRNPGSVPVVFDGGWVLWHQSAQNTCQPKVKRYQGQGQTIPPYGRLLLVGLDYAQAVAPDDVLMSTPGNSLSDSASLWIEHNGVVMDALCYYVDAQALAKLQGACAQPYVCLGTPVSNLPHDGSTMGGVDASLSRKEDALGHPVNTRNNAVDFTMVSPATPQGLSTP